MNKEELKQKVLSLVPEAVLDDTGEFLAWNIDAPALGQSVEKIRAGLGLDFLFCLTGVDWKTHLAVNYHFTSSNDRETVLVLKAKIADRENPEIETVSKIWRTAEFHELETYDLFGIRFTGHPGLRRLFLTDDWKGWPMRKDYVDPVNMIDL